MDVTLDLLLLDGLQEHPGRAVEKTSGRGLDLALPMLPAPATDRQLAPPSRHREGGGRHQHGEDLPGHPVFVPGRYLDEPFGRSPRCPARRAGSRRIAGRNEGGIKGCRDLALGGVGDGRDDGFARVGIKRDEGRRANHGAEVSLARSRLGIFSSHGSRGSRFHLCWLPLFPRGPGGGASSFLPRARLLPALRVPRGTIVGLMRTGTPPHSFIPGYDERGPCQVGR